MKSFYSLITGIFIIALSIIIFLSLLSYHPQDIAFLTYPLPKTYHNLVGIIGAYLSFSLLFILGYSSFVIPGILFILGLNQLGLVTSYGIAKGKLTKLLSFLLLLGTTSTLGGIFFNSSDNIYSASGIVGFYFSTLLRKYLGFWGAFIILTITSIVLFIMIGGSFFKDAYILLKKVSIFLFKIIKSSFKKFFLFFVKKPLSSRELSPKVSRIAKEEKAQPKIRISQPSLTIKEHLPSSQPKYQEDKKDKVYIKEFSKKNIEYKKNKGYNLPYPQLLKLPVFKHRDNLKNTIKENIYNLETTLKDFGVGAKVVSVQRGPVVTMYELQPESGVKIQKITALVDDIALAMKSAGVRVVAPIPGRGTIGVEIPNHHKQLVYLREVLEDKKFATSSSKLTLGLGKDIKGDVVVTDLKDMPHLLIAGTTGSGKTVCVNSLISSILFKAKPDEVKFILIDPKKVELAPYQRIPHLLHPIISDAKRAVSALSWAVEEMENRYRQLAEEGKRNIESINANSFKMPYIVIIIDELADLMIVAKDKIETTVQRLAQLSRAVGIHLILATQRPSVDVITGVIKANFPARISFKVSSKVDSRTVLDLNGAEKLLGKGDLLFLKPGVIKPIRAQCAFIDDEDIEHLTDFVKAQAEPVYEKGILEAQKKTETHLEKDELLDEAIKVVLITKQASASLLQRRLRVGYTRAARLLDLMEEEGIVGPFLGSKPRQILVDPNTYFKGKELTKEKQ